MEIVELKDPGLLRTWTVSDLFRRTFPPGSLVTGGFEEAQERFAALVTDPRYRFLLGVESDELRGLACLFLPRGTENVHAQVLAFYNDGSVRLRQHLVDALVDLARQEGHMKLWAINQTGKPDSVWARMFSRAGESQRVGSVMEVTLKGNEES